ncbi:MAG: right-handed parallel beta-helix repeat-containing protein [Desulfobacteraceae bacterium]
MSRLFNRLSILIVPWMALVFAPPLAISATIAGGTISTDTTLTLAGSPYTITGSLTVQGVDGADGITTLTIEPGVELRFNAGYSLSIGSSSGNSGAVRAVGSESQPIVFTSNQTNPWGGILFQNTSHNTACLLDYCVVEKTSQWNVYINGSNPSIRHSTLRESRGDGINISNSGSPEINGCIVSANAKYGVFCHTASLSPLITESLFSANGSYPLRIGANAHFTDNTFIGNVTQAVEILGEDLTKDHTWKDIGVPYHIYGRINIIGTDGEDNVTTLTIEPGAVILFNTSSGLNVGSPNANPGALRAVGEAERQITFKPLLTNTWNGICFYNTSRDDLCILDYCIVEKGINSNIRVEASNPVIKRSVIRNGSVYGVFISEAAPVLNGNTISDNGGTGIYASCSSMKPVIASNAFNNNGSYPVHVGASIRLSGNTYSGNAVQAIDMVGETITADNVWENPGIPYQITGNVTVQGTSGPDGVTTLTVEPGAELRFNDRAYLYVGGSSGNPGALNAVGEISKPVVFTSNQPTKPWNGICFLNTSLDSACILDRCIIEKAQIMNIQMRDANPSITRCTIRNSGYHGIYISTGSPVLTENIISSNGTYGIYCTATNSRPLINGNTLSFNRSYPLRIGANLSIGNNTIESNLPQAIEIIGETITLDTTWKNMGVAYHITGQITVQGVDGTDGVTTLTVEPGVELRFNSGVNLYIGNSSGAPGALKAVGDTDHLVTFTSNQASPWYGLCFRNTAHDSLSVLDYCVVEKASNMNIRLNDAHPAIRNSEIRNSGNYGIYGYGAGANGTVIECCNIRDNKYGIYTTTGCTSMTITNNNIHSNSTYGLYHSSTTQLCAETNWWGAATGPGLAGSVVYGNVKTYPYLKEARNCEIPLLYGDSDYDNLLDSWEMEYFGNLSHDGEEDYDNDGFSNVVEYIMSTNPNELNQVIQDRVEFNYDSSGRIIKVIIN